MNEGGLWPPARELALIQSQRAPVPARAIRDVRQRFIALGLTTYTGLVDRVHRRPLVAAVLTTALLVALAAPALSPRPSKPSDLALSARGDPALQALADVRRAFPSAGETAVIAAQAPSGTHVQLVRALARLRRLAVGSRLIPATLGRIPGGRGDGDRSCRRGHRLHAADRPRGSRWTTTCSS